MEDIAQLVSAKPKRMKPWSLPSNYIFDELFFNCRNLCILLWINVLAKEKWADSFAGGKMTENCSYESKFHSVQCYSTFHSKIFATAPELTSRCVSDGNKKNSHIYFHSGVYTVHTLVFALLFTIFFIRVLCLHRAP